jgi:hypothetical protein
MTQVHAAIVAVRVTKWSIGFCQGKAKLDEKLREKLVVAIEKSLLGAGAKDYEDGIETTKKLLEWAYQNIQSIQTRDGLRAALDSCPPMSKREETIALFISAGLPLLIRTGLQIAAKKAAATIPAPKGGRPSAIPPQKVGEVLDCVAGLIRRGCTVEAAIYRTAQRFGGSERTILRLWAKRGSMTDDELTPAVTVDEVIEYITS